MTYSMCSLLFTRQTGAKSHWVCLEIGDGGKDLPADDLKRLNPVDLRNHAKDRLNPHRGEPAQLPDQLAHFGAILAHVEGERTRLLNRIIIPALSLTMLAQDLQLLGDLWARTHIAGIGVAGDQAQGLLLAGARNQNWRMGACEALRQVEWTLDAVVLSLERTLIALFALPHAQADLHHLLQPLVALFEWRERQSRADCLLFVIASANAQPRTATRKHIQGGDRLGEQDGVPVRACRCHGQQPDPAGVGRQVRQGGIARGHLVFWPAQIVALPHMVHRPDPIKSPGLGGLCDADQRRAKLTRALWPRKIIETKSQFHKAIPPLF